VLLREVKEFRQSFSLSGLATSIFLGLAPSAWDTGSDFAFAKAETENNFISTLTYLIISLPGIFIAFTGLQRVTSSAAVRWCHYKGYGNLSRLSNFILLGMLGGVIFATYFLFYYLPGGFFYSAVITASFILGSKVVALVVHGPEMKKVAVRMTALESQYESSLQLFLVLLTWFNSGEASSSSLSSALSSILVIGKSGAESFLTFGHDNQLEVSGTLQRLKLLAIYSPVFTLTAIFRLMALAAILAFIDWHSTIFVFLPLIVGKESRGGFGRQLE